MECRLCLRSISEQSSVFIFGDQKSVQESIWSCCHLRVNRDDRLPNTICLLCDSSLKSLMDFKKLSLQSDANAKLALTQYTGIKVEEVLVDDLVWEDDIDCDPVSGNKSLKCDICSKVFARRCNLTIHMKRHSGERSHKCDVCAKRFVIGSELKRHMKCHTEERPHKCDICSMYFVMKSNLTLHMESHPWKRSHKCDVCSKCFVLKNNLTIHMKCHTEEKT